VLLQTYPFFRNLKKFGVNVVVALNQFTSETPAEIDLVLSKCLQSGADEAVVANHWALGGKVRTKK
jgi:methylenetetrahydrofolate dehydrogenase (NADP+)/methenyltetrahydrofolate cyclohydrolase/formyltetrahydrofolate synthetase